MHNSIDYILVFSNDEGQMVRSPIAVGRTRRQPLYFLYTPCINRQTYCALRGLCYEQRWTAPLPR